ncbi:MAG: hypothetical protein JXB00_00065 [Bacteroidales bacterium]|nr:hypothetical protein [Bacteroidales bacterium]
MMQLRRNRLVVTKIQIESNNTVLQKWALRSSIFSAIISFIAFIVIIITLAITRVQHKEIIFNSNNQLKSADSISQITIRLLNKQLGQNDSLFQKQLENENLLLQFSIQPRFVVFFDGRYLRFTNMGEIANVNSIKIIDKSSKIFIGGQGSKLKELKINKSYDKGEKFPITISWDKQYNTNPDLNLKIFFSDSYGKNYEQIISGKLDALFLTQPIKI